MEQTSSPEIQRCIALLDILLCQFGAQISIRLLSQDVIKHNPWLTQMGKFDVESGD